MPTERTLLATRKNAAALLAGAALLVALAALVVSILAFQRHGAQTQPNGSAEIPTVVGMPEADATARLRAAGFTVRASPIHSVSAPLGTVLSQAPLAGSRIPPGRTVTLTIAAGP
jgi:serine/threonine-protein kinase